MNNMPARTYKLLKDGKGIFLAYDQGLEHGPIDFNLENINPEYVINIAEKGDYNAIILHHGIAEKYYSHHPHKNKVPLIIKLNGKTKLGKEIVSSQVCSVKRALNLGASGVGYTIYPGSPYEHLMLKEFGSIVEKAHDNGLAVVAWIYPRGNNIDELSTANIAYAARIGLELGADIIKLKYNNDLEGFKWAVKAAGKAKVMVAGGEKLGERELLKRTYDIIQAGASGLAIGRNVWQSNKPLKITKALKEIIFNNKKVDEVIRLLK